MSVTLWRASSRSSSLVIRGRYWLQQSSDRAASSRTLPAAMTVITRHPKCTESMAGVVSGTNASISHHCRNHYQAKSRPISTSTLHQKSAAVPLSALIDDDDDTKMEQPPASNNTNSNSTPFLLADIGEGISEVELLQWFVAPGDTVVQFDRICEVQSDKASVEITSRFDGVVERMCGEVGDMMFVGKPLMYIATENGGNSVGPEVVEHHDQQAQEVGRTQQKTTTLNNVDDEQDRLHIPSVGTNYSSYYDKEETILLDNSPHEGGARSAVVTTKTLTSPAVRKLGKENNIDLGTILGTGPGGRVLKADVLKIINASSSSSSMPLGSPRESTTSSSTTTPPISSSPEMGVSKLTYLPFFIKAASLAMRKYPVLNSTIDVEEMTLTYRAEHNIGVAVDTERGLAVPVVRGCEGRSVLDIAMELNRLYSLAMEGNLCETDISDPTFTLSNIGAIGGTYMSPVVLPPQVAIGAMGKIQRLPRFVNDESDEVEAVRIMPISWGGDHRAVDGATMAKFSNLWKAYCENPSSMMFAMR
ncbi:hypothetical protein ACHAXR_008265 [Thalassiosira sp. AJA248-18]